jgi:tRNA-2-methylthio-N6-dimethylallyladenosine synthase
MLEEKGYKKAKSLDDADYIIINTCMVREQAEDRIYGLVRNIRLKRKNKQPKIVISGCLPGAAEREPSREFAKKIKIRLSGCELLLNEKIGLKCPAVRGNKRHALVPISNGCNNFCSYCIVPYSRGREISRPFKDIIEEVKKLAKEGYEEITLLGQNVNSYRADIVNSKLYKLPDGRRIKPVLVKHLGKTRIPTLFPYLLDAICQISGIKKVNFLSSNPWDFSDELIEVIAKNEKINRHIHLPVQSGDDKILFKMNRHYSSKEYLDLVKKIKKRIPQASFGTDIIVGFPGETEKAFKNTVKLCQKVGFEVAYIGKYSPRPGTASKQNFPDDVSSEEKNRRFHILDNQINKKKQNLRIIRQ